MLGARTARRNRRIWRKCGYCRWRCAGEFALGGRRSAARRIVRVLAESVPRARALASACANAPAFSCGRCRCRSSRTGAVPGTISLERRAQAGRRRTQPRRGRGARRRTRARQRCRSANSSPRRSRRRSARATCWSSTSAAPAASDPLSCAALEQLQHAVGASQLVRTCASQIGPARARFTTQESVQDIEALRHAGGYEKLVLYGTSYGTKVALEYAERYPAARRSAGARLGRAERTGRNRSRSRPSRRSRRARRAVRRRRLRRDHAPTRSATSRSLAAQLHRRAAQRLGLRRLRQAPREHARRARPAAHPRGRRPEPRAARAAAGGRALGAARRPRSAAAPEPARRGPDPERAARRRRGEGSAEVDEALFFATSCEETPFPWQRGAPAATRLRRSASASCTRSRAADFYPFDADTASTTASIPACAGWPDASPPPPAARRAAERADADLLRRAGPAHADRERARGRRADPRRAAAGRPLHRALGHRQRPQRLRRRWRSRRSSPAAGAAVHAPAPTCSRRRR